MKDTVNFAVIEAYARYRYDNDNETYLELDQEQTVFFKELLHQAWKNEVIKMGEHLKNGGRWAVLGDENAFEERLRAIIEICDIDNDIFMLSRDHTNENRPIFLIDNPDELKSGNTSQLKIYVLNTFDRDESKFNSDKDRFTFSIAMLSNIEMIYEPRT